MENPSYEQVGDQTYYGGLGQPLGFGHGHINHNTGYHRPPVSGPGVANALGWTAIMGAAGKSNVNIGR